MPRISEERWNSVIRWIDHVAKPLVVISVVLYLIEDELNLRNHGDDSYQPHSFFIWSERLIAGLFTVEIIARWWRSNPKFYGAPNSSYPFNAWGAIDLLCVAPFWLSFVVPVSLLGVVRSLRILRLLKFFRYSRTLQLTALMFYRAYHSLKGVVFALGVVWLFFAVVCLNLEYKGQPDKFGSLLDGAWFTVVTATTVGYGDASPVSIWGKIFVGLMLVPIISTMGMAFSAFSNACDSVQKLEDDPNIDPIEEWKKERSRAKARKQADQEYTMNE